MSSVHVRDSDRHRRTSTFAAMGKRSRFGDRRISTSRSASSRHSSPARPSTANASASAAPASAPAPVGVEWWIGAGAPVALERTDVGTAIDQPPNQAQPSWRPTSTPVNGNGRTRMRRCARTSGASTPGDLLATGYRGMPRAAEAYGAVDDVAEQLSVFKDIGFDEVTVRCMTVIQADAIETLDLCGEFTALAGTARGSRRSRSRPRR